MGDLLRLGKFFSECSDYGASQSPHKLFKLRKKSRTFSAGTAVIAEGIFCSSERRVASEELRPCVEVPGGATASIGCWAAAVASS